MTTKKAVSHVCRVVLFATVSLGAFSTAAAAETGRAPLLDLNDGGKIPQFGLGTWLGFGQKGPVKPVSDEVSQAVRWAIDAGYRHIDTAHIYDTETQVGAAVKDRIAAGVVKREDLFITTKLWNDRHAKDAVVPGLRESLQKLGLDYVDLYLIHWPVGQFANQSFDHTDYLETWEGMVEAKKLGLVKHIGVSNFNKDQLQRLWDSTSEKPSVLQIELNLNLQQAELRNFCKSKGIVIMAYTPFGSLFSSKAMPDAPPPRVSDPEIKAIADRHKKTVPQIALKYLVELGVIPIPKSVNKNRVEENFNIFDFSLTEEDKKILMGYDKNYRTIAVKFWLQSPFYPFERT